MRIAQFGKLICLAVCLSGCVSTPKDSEEQVALIIASRIGKETQWHRGCQADPRLQAHIQELASNPLSSESAVQIALLNHPSIQAIFEELGIAQADLVEAGLLSNPVFEVEVRYPHEKKLHTNIEYLVTTAFLDIFLIPLRTRLASTELEQTKVRVSNQILDLAFDVRQTYYDLIAEQQKLKYTLAIVELTDIQKEIIARQNSVGNVNSLDFQQNQINARQAQLEIAKAQSELIRLREKFNRLLGFSEDRDFLLLDEISEELDYRGFDLAMLESIALTERLDLQLDRFEVLRFCRLLGIKDWWTYTNLRVGVAGERDPDGTNVVGYGISGEIPIFNYGQAARMRLFAQLRQAQNRLAAKEMQILSEVREAHKLLMNEWGIIHEYRLEILPLQNQILHSSEAFYNVMGLGIDRLLENKRQEFNSYRHYLESLKDYWKARVQLDRALGGYLFRLLPQEHSLEERVIE